MTGPVDTTVVEAPPVSFGGGRAGTLIRAAVSIVALALVFSRVPPADVLAAILSLDPAWFLAAFGAVYAAIVLSAYKWLLLLRARGYSVGIVRLTRHYLVGLFFNNFLPTSVGGDVVRAWDVGKDLDDAPGGAASVIAERLIASLGLGLTAALGLPFVEAGPQATVAVVVVLAASATLVALFLMPSRSAGMMRGAMGGRFEGVSDWVGEAVCGVRETLHHRGAVVLVLVLSMLFQVLVAAVNYCIFEALGSPVGLAECIVYSSIVSAVTMVPISISGHGVREAGYAYFFGLAGVPASLAVTGSLLFFLFVAVATLPGAVLFALGGRR
ncbi:MAG: lysylphosphatidylglycerol synthase transmembrane domain-containing protein [Anaerosomatales bacterium]|nr:lysylphosphatidylglycerol synthase transmembrane domain-containing protein [Anaerosomatales bacterium]MDT8434211.1 lysylphosphatidylglycerol synthase transmembrane domain-containing protein [Anaerosomatales bacterium]